MTAEEKEFYFGVYGDYPDLLNLEQTCKMLGGVSKKSVYGLLQRKEIEAFMIGKRYYIPKIRVLEYLHLAKHITE